MGQARTVSVTLLAGGVGGAKMAEGLSQLEFVELTVIGNIADDAEFHGLWVSPDIDTMLYTLSGRVNREQGWGVSDDALRALSVLNDLGQDIWMTLGDRDLGLHIYRTHLLRQGEGRQAITDRICRAFGVPCRILLPTEDVVQTHVRTMTGWLGFQEYFVRERCEPSIFELRYDGIDLARPNAAAIAAIEAADMVVIAPSNPLVSIRPIIDIPQIKSAVRNSNGPKIAVCPLVNGKALKGPADRMMESLGIEASVGSIADEYSGFADVLLIDTSDRDCADDVSKFGIRPVCANIVMRSLDDKKALAREVVRAALGHCPGGSDQ